MIDIGGYRLAIHTTGPSHGPTVVLESGSLMPSVLWSLVEKEVAPFALVCRYDRAGYGDSESAPGRRTGEQIVTDLHTMLTKAGLAAPYILVGHSLGGMYVRLFAKRYPDLVAGVVLVDAFEENVRDSWGPAMQRADRFGRSAMVLASYMGILPWMVRRNRDFPFTGRPGWRGAYSAQEQQQIRAQLYRPKLTRAALREWLALGETEAALKAKPSLGSVPLHVLSRGRPDLDGWGLKEEAKAQFWERERATQARLAALSSISRHTVVSDTGHMIYVEQPGAVAAAIREMVEQTLS